MSTSTDLNTLVINYLTEQQYQAEVTAGTVDPDALYFTPSSGGGGTITDVKVNNTSVVTSGVANIIMPTKVSDLTNDSGFITSYTETDPVFSASAAAGITSSDISNWDGKINTAGTGLSKSGTTLNHSNSVTAQTTSAVYPIKIDAQGHISEYGSAVTIPTKVSDLTNDSGFITGYTETDPVFNSSVAAGITSTDITNWNNKTSNTGTVTSINLISGTGITVSNSNTAITTSGSRTITLNTIKTSKNSSGLGGAQVWKSWENGANITPPTTIGSYTSTFTVQDSTTIANRYYPIEATYDGHLIVNIPWESIPTNISAFTNDSGFVTTDEKVKQTPISTSSSNDYGLVVSYGNGSTETTNYVRTTDKIYIDNSTPSIIVGKSTDTQRLSVRPDRISFIYNSGNLQGYLKSSNITTSDKTWTLPDKTGTVALTSDIPVSTATPTASTVSKFDSNAKMNSTNMTSSEVTTFVESLDISGGGGSVPIFNTATITLTTAGWSNNSQTVTVQGVTASNIVIVNPAPASYDEYVVDNVRCTGQSANSLTFTCDFVPDAAITVSVIITSVTTVYGGEVS